MTRAADVSIAAIAWVFDHAPTVDATEHVVLLAIANRCRNDDGTGAYPSLSTLARDTRLNRRTVVRALERLVARQVVKVEPGIGRASNCYTIIMTANQGHSATSDTAPLVTQRHQGSDTAPLVLGAQRHLSRGAAPPDPYVNRTENRTRTGEGFEAVWAIYPKKTGKHLAKEAYAEVVGDDGDLHQQVLSSVQAHAASADWQKDQGRWVPQLAKFLHERRFDDEPPADGPVYDKWDECRICGDVHKVGECPQWKCRDCGQYHNPDQYCSQRKAREFHEQEAREIAALADAEGLTPEQARETHHTRKMAAFRESLRSVQRPAS